MKYTFTLFMLAVFSIIQAQQKHIVYFDFDIDEANSPSVTKLDDWMVQNKNAVIQKVYGYADSKGSNDYNVDLSQRRAYHVVKKLRENGFTVNDSVEIKAFGEDFEQDKNQAKNRKVEIYFTAPLVEVKKEPQPEKPEFTQKVEQSKRGDKLRLPKLYFYNNSDIVVPGSKPTLSELLVIMRNNPKLKIDIQGHICCQLTETGDISRKRAKAVYDFLVRNGIDKTRLSYQGLKSNHPIYPLPERSEAERDANRRVEIEIIEN